MSANPVTAPTRGHRISFRLPVLGWPRAVFRSDFGYRDAQIEVNGTQVLHARSREELERGVSGNLDAAGASIVMQLVPNGGARALRILVGDREAIREDRVWARPTRSAWIHGVIALAGSGAGFVASYFYLLEARVLQSPWALKMALHTAGWHLLLTLTLFPASVWGQRAGIRVVQAVSLLFFFIHASIALANSGPETVAIAVFNAMSGVLFFASVLYGQRAYRDMDPIGALRDGRI